LTEPTEISCLSYQPVFPNINETISNCITSSFIKSGRCDAYVIWVDYDLNDDGVRLQFCVDSRFPSYCKLNLKFLPTPTEVVKGQEFHVKTDFEYGNSDFQYDFSISST
jgi:hypothetical protein